MHPFFAILPHHNSYSDYLVDWLEHKYSSEIVDDFNKMMPGWGSPDVSVGKLRFYYLNRNKPVPILNPPDFYKYKEIGATWYKHPHFETKKLI